MITETKTYKVFQGWWVDKTGQLYWFKAVQNDEGLFYVTRRNVNSPEQEEVVGWLTEEELKKASLSVIITKEIRR